MFFSSSFDSRCVWLSLWFGSERRPLRYSRYYRFCFVETGLNILIVWGQTDPRASCVKMITITTKSINFSPFEFLFFFFSLLSDPIKMWFVGVITLTHILQIGLPDTQIHYKEFPHTGITALIGDILSNCRPSSGEYRQKVNEELIQQDWKRFK